MNQNPELSNAHSENRARYILIKGITEDGKRFRPSDWAERLATAVGHCGADRRLRFHPHVRIANIDGEKCVVVNAALEDKEPLLFEFLLRFAKSNQLRIELKDNAIQTPLREVRVG